MTDDPPPTVRSGLPPVRMALRVVGRHGAGRAGGRRLARAVVSARAPKHLAASTPIAHPGAPPEPAPEPAPGAVGAQPAGAAVYREPAPAYQDSAPETP